MFHMREVRFMVFNATIFELYRGGQFYRVYPEKTTDLRKSLTNFIT